MKQVMTVFRYTFKEAVHKKSFKISSIVLFAGILLIFVLIAALSGTGTGTDADAAPGEAGYRLYYIDEQGLIPGGAQALSEALGAEVTQADAAQYEEYKRLISEDGDLALVQVTPDDGSTSWTQRQNMPMLRILTKDVMSGIPTDAITDTLSRQYAANLMREAGVDEQIIAISGTPLIAVTDIAGQMDLTGYVLGLILVMLLFFCVYFYGYGVAMSVANEKTSRVMETLVVSAKPSRILIGKVLAMGAVGLLQFLGILAVAALGYTFILPEGVTLFGAPLSFAAFTPGVAALVVVYFILGYILYAVLNSVCGATVSKIEDLNTAMMPVMFVALISFYLAYFSAIAGSGAMETIAMYLPFSSPFLMPFLLLNSEVPAGAIIGSIALLVVMIEVVLFLSIRVYSASVLHYGGRLRWKDAYRTKT